MQSQKIIFSFKSAFAAFVYWGVASATLINLHTSSSVGKQLFNDTRFDYIIVGGGLTGLTLARRLSEDRSKTVLVLEAGRTGASDPLVTVPENSFAFIGTDIDWFYFTAPQKHASGQAINLSSGKILGGGSSVNGLQWTQPHKTDYDDWEALGSPGWNWGNLYAASHKSEKLNIPSKSLTAQYGYTANPASHGTNGPVDVAFPPWYPLQHLQFINASIELGHQFNVDPYGGDNTGIWFSLSSQTAQSVRSSSEFAYRMRRTATVPEPFRLTCETPFLVDPVLTRSNLFVAYQATVTKLDITSGKKENVKSTGVRVRFTDGSESVAKVTNTGEVVMTAGSIRTPQLFELSGIGNQDILRKNDIPVKLDLPGVGENFEDHTLVIITYQLKPGFLSYDALSYNATLADEQQRLYETKREGWLTFANGVVNMAPANIVLTKDELKTAQQLLKNKPNGISTEAFNIIKKNVFSGVPQAEYILFNSFSGGDVKLPNTSYVSMAISHLHPLSRGNIHINSTSIDDHPIIDPHVLEAEWDKWFLAKATAYGRKFFQTSAFGEIFESVEVFPGPQVTEHAQWEQFVKDTVNLGYHPVGTASLLPKNKKGVVDPNLRVYGTDNIRVADASIIPLLVSAHTQLPAYAIAERAAELIKSA